MDLIFSKNLSYKNIFLSKNPIKINVDPADINISDRSGLRYYLTLFFPRFIGDKDYENWQSIAPMQAIEEPVKIISGNIHQSPGAFFYIEEVLQSYLDSGNKFPNLISEISQSDNQIIPFYYKTKVLNNGVIVGTELKSDIFYCIDGGINPIDFKIYGQNFFKTFIGAGKKFLSYSPIFKILPNQKIFLTWVNFSQPAAKAIKLRAERTFTDGSVDDEPFFVSVIAAEFMEVYHVPVHPELMKHPTKQVASYSVWLVDHNNEVISETKNYTIDYSEYENLKTIVFRNSLGGYDFMNFVGDSSQVSNITREIQEKLTDISQIGSYSESKINSIESKNRIILNTHFISDKELDWLKELIFSKEIFLFSEKGYIPLIVENEEFLNESSFENNSHGREISFIYSEKVHSFSDLPPIEMATDRPTGWKAYGNNYVCELNEFGIRTSLGRPVTLAKYYLDDDSLVKPITTKPNKPGTEGYIDNTNQAACSVTEFLNERYEREGTFIRNNCPNGQNGGVANIIIPAGRWGSEISQADANNKAIAEWNALNTQDYANLYGTCTNFISNKLNFKFYRYSFNATFIPPANVFSFQPFLNIDRPTIEITSEFFSQQEILATYIAAKIKGYIKAPITGLLNLYISSDDGCRVRFNNELILDDWLNHPATENKRSVSVVEGMFYPIEIDYFEYEGGEYFNIQWDYTGQTKQNIPSNYLFIDNE